MPGADNRRGAPRCSSAGRSRVGGSSGRKVASPLSSDAISRADVFHVTARRDTAQENRRADPAQPASSPGQARFSPFGFSTDLACSCTRHCAFFSTPSFLPPSRI
eukprot:1559694-Rhodomonas_salina.1